MIPATDSEARRPPVPTEASQLFRGKAAICRSEVTLVFLKSKIIGFD